MSGMLTVQSVMMCPHGGTVQAIPSATNVQIGGASMLTIADTFIVAGCPFLIGIVPFPCVSVQWVGPATRSNLGAIPTLNAASVGLCLSAAGSPQGPVMIVAVQPNVSGQ